MDESLRRDSIELCGLMEALQRLMGRKIRRTLDDCGVNLPQYHALGIIGTLGRPTMTVLAGHLGVTTAATTGLVERLVRSELVNRLHNPKDRRKVMVALTDRGREVHKRCSEELGESLADLLRDVPVDDRQSFLRVYRLLADAARQRAGT